jgi:hypothetical protein
MAYTGIRKSATHDFDLLISNQITNRIRILSKLKSNAHGDLTFHAGISGNINLIL